MIAEICLSVCLVAVLLFHFWSAKQGAEERRQLINHIQSRTPGEFIALQRASGVVAKPKDPDREAVNVPVNPMGL